LKSNGLSGQVSSFREFGTIHGLSATSRGSAIRAGVAFFRSATDRSISTTAWLAWRASGAKNVGAEATAAVLLGGHAGLRRGEMVALEWSDDFKRGQLTVRRGQWEGEVVAPKGGVPASCP